MAGKWSLKQVWLICFIAASVISLGFAGHVLNLRLEEYDGLMAWVKDSNLHFYFVMLLLFMVTFLAVRAGFILLKPVESKGCAIYRLSFRRQGVLVAVPVVLVLGFLLHWLCIEQFTEFPYGASTRPLYMIPPGIACSLFCGGVLLAFYMVIRKRDISAFCLYAVYAFCMVLCFYSLYFVNIFKADFHHGVAVLESIYNVCDLIPFSEATTGIYGHYSLFFMLPMRMAHGSQYMAAGLLALSGCIMTAASFYVFQSFLPKNWLRAVMACAGIFVVAVYRENNYWQVQPIRELFPALVCAYACFLRNKRVAVWHTKWMWAGYALVSLAILWNTESGLFCLAAFSAWLIVGQLQAIRGLGGGIALLLYGRVALYGMGCILLSVGYVELYNLFCGGKLIFRAFFFPLFTESYMDGVIRYDMPWGNHAWAYVFILFTAVLAWGLYHTRLFKGAGSDMCKDAPAAVLVSVLGLLSLSYYVNRAAQANLTVCYCEALYANVLVIRQTWPALHHWALEVRLEDLGKKAAAIISIVVVACLGAELPLSSIRMVANHPKEVYSTEGISEDLEAMAESIPENVYGVGKGISILYHMLGWGNYAHVRDFSDFWVGSDAPADVVLEEALRQDGFLMSGDDVSLLTRLLAWEPYYRVAGVYQIQGREFYYYQKGVEKMTDYLMKYVSASEENEKTAEGAIYVNPGQLLSSPSLYLEAGEYILHVTLTDAANVQIHHGKDTNVLLRQELGAGESLVSFSLPEGVRDLVFQIDNTGQEEVALTGLYLEGKDG